MRIPSASVPCLRMCASCCGARRGVGSKYRVRPEAAAIAAAPSKPAAVEVMCRSLVEDLGSALLFPRLHQTLSRPCRSNLHVGDLHRMLLDRAGRSGSVRVLVSVYSMAAVHLLELELQLASRFRGLHRSIWNHGAGCPLWTWKAHSSFSVRFPNFVEALPIESA
mmetsp:Transcript_3708/g.10589  ORF Transcript_3708/g.10589 Transcript_3708/m.10589 type:complete len:165 (-) Transcript_3708:36-530(-)